jgi:enamine deaminase RidA (YjgF/YER057c/UK114 family)
MIEEKLKELGYELPEAPKPLAAYIPGIKINNLIYTSGQVALLNGQLKYKGKVGRDLSEEDGKKAAELCALNCLSIVKSLAGSLDNVQRIVKLTVFISSAEGFTNQPEVANGASELIEKIFGEKGKHVRSAVGVCELPRNSAVEIEMVANVTD